MSTSSIKGGSRASDEDGKTAVKVGMLTLAFTSLSEFGTLDISIVAITILFERLPSL
jgi:hypothetical protein